jgi:nitroreductase
VRLKTDGQELPEKHVNRIRKKLATPPVLLVVSQLITEDDFRRKEDYAAVACAIQNISLSLWSEGVGSKWSSGGVTRHEETYQIADVDPVKEEIVGFVWAGYADIVPDPPRLPLEQVLRETP